jgi:glycogen synthase
MHSPFAWLESIAPPLLVLSTAYVLKEQLLDAIETRHANERAYQEAVNLWQSATADPESHPHWMQFYANALRDAIRKANNRRKDALAELTTTDDKSKTVGIIGCRYCQLDTDKSGE